MSSAMPKEIRYLYMAAAGNVLIGIVGISVFMVSESEAILLDGLFNLTYAVTGLFAVRIAWLLSLGDSAEWPLGYNFFEPLVNGVKGMLVLGVSVMALIGSVEALIAGGRNIDAGMAVSYGVFASAVCWGMAWFVHRGAKATDSPLLIADAENWLVNAAISSCVLLAFGGIFLLKALELEHLTPYVDPLVVLIVVLLSISVPVRMAWNALMSLLNRAPNQATMEAVTASIDTVLNEVPLQSRFVRMIQPGRQRLVGVYLVFEPNQANMGLAEQDALRQKIHDKLTGEYPATTVDVIFTQDKQWAEHTGIT
ncbi:cation diffusion facilitator family transporter [Paraferrimonas sedimenticola]|uniref:Cation efflux family transporter n=1 Tax=Paraferrimonas sedimenticola TaxID=375674 RepID=A0AA37RTY6_9GAMM|nr:cation transporter [Paraferrimonas sedimenticola]GLP95705.1 cation efflux family transporter [Paraferrimonas sedimenticola]